MRRYLSVILLLILFAFLSESFVFLHLLSPFLSVLGQSGFVDSYNSLVASSDQLYATATDRYNSEENHY